MDPSLGDRKASLWRSTEDKKGAKEKKEAKKPHWLVAKEAGKRKNGSEKRKKRAEPPSQTAPAAAPPAKKKKKVARETAMEARAMDAEHQRDYVWGTLKEAIAGVVEGRMPPETAFVASPAMQRAATVGERIQAAIESGETRGQAAQDGARAGAVAGSSAVRGRDQSDQAAAGPGSAGSGQAVGKAHGRGGAEDAPGHALLR